MHLFHSTSSSFFCPHLVTSPIKKLRSAARTGNIAASQIYLSPLLQTKSTLTRLPPSLHCLPAVGDGSQGSESTPPGFVPGSAAKAPSLVEVKDEVEEEPSRPVQRSSDSRMSNSGNSSGRCRSDMSAGQ